MSSPLSPSSIDGFDILVTGGNGYIGSHTILELINEGANPVIIDSLSNSSIHCHERLEQITGKAIPIHTISLLDRDKVEQVFIHQLEARKKPFDTVIHFAGFKSVGESMDKVLEYYDNNVTSSINLLLCMKKYGCFNLVFSSSCTVYGIPSSCPVDELGELHTNSVYGKTKSMIEGIIKDYCQSSPLFNAVILRYFNPIGAHRSGLVGEAPQGVPNQILPYLTQVAIGKLPFVRVFGNDWPTRDGTGVRDYIDIEDLARGHVMAIREGVFNRKNKVNPSNGEALSNFECYNLGTGNGVSVMEMIKYMETACGNPIRFEIHPRRLGDVAEIYGDASKAKRVLNWEAKTSPQDSVNSAWKWQSGNPNGYEGQG